MGEGAGEGPPWHVDKCLLSCLLAAPAKAVYGCKPTLLSSMRWIMNDAHARGGYSSMFKEEKGG